MVICMERGADLHMAELMPLPLTVSCFSEIQTGFAFLILADLGSPGQRAINWVCVCVQQQFCVRSGARDLCDGVRTWRRPYDAHSHGRV